MKIAFGADESTECTMAVLGYLQEYGDEVLETGGRDTPWPVYARRVGELVAQREADLGVVMCWTGTGTCIAANKVHGVRAASAWEPWIARGARYWNDANVLALSHKRLAPDVAVECVKAFLETPGYDPAEAENIDQLRDR